jgi:hypothetical protein
MAGSARQPDLSALREGLRHSEPQLVPTSLSAGRASVRTEDGAAPAPNSDRNKITAYGAPYEWPELLGLSGEEAAVRIRAQRPELTIEQVPPDAAFEQPQDARLDRGACPWGFARSEAFADPRAADDTP